MSVVDSLVNASDQQNGGFNTKKIQHKSCVKFSILIRISFELPNLQTPIDMALVESSWEGEEAFFN